VKAWPGDKLFFAGAWWEPCGVVFGKFL